MERGVPPEYDSRHESNGNPPPYSSLYGKIKDARKESDGQGDFVKKFCQIICNTIGFTILLAVFLTVPILMVVVGALNLNNCSIQYLIPIWLIVSGVFAGIQQIMSLVDRVRGKNKEDDEEQDTPTYVTCGNALLGCFNFAWFICGCVWVYQIYAPNTNLAVAVFGLPYCDHLTYYLAFWILTLAFILLGLILCCGCCVMIMLAVGSK